MPSVTSREVDYFLGQQLPDYRAFGKWLREKAGADVDMSDLQVVKILLNGRRIGLPRAKGAGVAMSREEVFHRLAQLGVDVE
jgi:hypothetical protein